MYDKRFKLRKNGRDIVVEDATPLYEKSETSLTDNLFKSEILKSGIVYAIFRWADIANFENKKTRSLATDIEQSILKLAKHLNIDPIKM